MISSESLAEDSVNGVRSLDIFDANVEVGLRIRGRLKKGVGHTHADGEVKEVADLEAEKVNVVGTAILDSHKREGEAARTGDGPPNLGKRRRSLEYDEAKLNYMELNYWAVVGMSGNQQWDDKAMSRVRRSEALANSYMNKCASAGLT